MKKDSITYLLREIIKKIYMGSGEKLEKYDISYSQYQTLMLLNHKKAFSMSELKKELLISPSTATVIIDKLVSKQLMKRYYDADDRRKVMVTISKGGSKLLKELVSEHEDFIKNLSKHIGQKETRTLKKSLRILLDYLNI